MINIHLVHPAQYHLFKNIISELSSKNIRTLLTIKNREFLEKLLINNNIKFESLGIVPSSKFLKLLFIPIYLLNTLVYLSNKKIRMIISCGSLDQLLASKILNIPHYVLDDTDDNWFLRKTVLPFIDKVYVPSMYKEYKNSSNIIRYNSCHEHSYLSMERFSPDEDVLAKYNILPNSNYSIVSFSSFDASHDVGFSGMKIKEKLLLIKFMETFTNPLITSELQLPQSLSKYNLRINPEDFHHILYYSSGYIGEGLTTGVEASLLGIPSIIINAREDCPNVKLMRKYKLLNKFDNFKIALPRIKKIISSRPSIHRKKSSEVSKSLIDVPAFISGEVFKRYGQ